MLTALESGVKGGKWYSLIDKVSSLRNLESGFAQVKRNKGSAGVDRVTIRMYRWPNAFFAEQGLFSLTTAYAQARQSSRRKNH